MPYLVRSIQRWMLLITLYFIPTTIATSFPPSPISSLFDDRLRDDNLHHKKTDGYLSNLFHRLSAIGIENLCHPTSDEFQPYFPKCYNYNNTSTLIDATAMQTKAATTRIRTSPTITDDYDPWSSPIVRHLEDTNQNQNDDNDSDSDDHNQWYYIVNGGLALLCVCVGALAAGLTVGLLSMDPLLLVIKMRGGETLQERQNAETLLPLVKQHHRLLVTLLLLNTISGEALPIFLQGLVPDSVAILASVVLVLIFGEIVPTAVFTGPNQLEIASRLAPTVKVLMFLMYPLTYPIARLLDKVMHDDDDSDCNDADNEEQVVRGGTLYTRGELAALIRVQYEERLITKQRRKHARKNSVASIPDNIIAMDTADIDIPITGDIQTLKMELLRQPQYQETTYLRSPAPPISTTNSIDGDEVMIMEGALQMKVKKAIDIYVSFHKVFCIPHNMTLDESNIFTIYGSGYSRIPVYDGDSRDRRAVRGILMTRQLIVVKPNQQDHAVILSDLNLYTPVCVSPDTNLVQLVNIFQTGGSAIRSGHMALVCAKPDIAHAALEQNQSVPEEAGLMGIITLEDVLEALLQEPIYDEMDAAGRMPIIAEREPSSSEEGCYHLA